MCRLGDRVEISTATVLEALQRNFGGLPASDFQQVVTAFLEHLRRACGHHKFPDPEPGQFRPTLEVLSASLEETGHNLLEQHATLSDKAARPKLVIDYTGIVFMLAAPFSSYICIATLEPSLPMSLLSFMLPEVAHGFLRSY